MGDGAILFDFDGVIVDSHRAIVPCINDALVAHGFPARPDDELRRFIGPRLSTAFAELTDAPPGSPLVDACVTTFREQYASAAVRHTTVVQGMAAVLAELARVHRLAIATSNPLAFTLPVVRRLRLGELFATIAGPALDAHGEDKAATIGRALDALGGGRAVMVGDRRHDVVGAHAHRLPFVGVTWGIGARRELRDAGADAIVDAPTELATACYALLGATGLRSQSSGRTNE